MERKKYEMLLAGVLIGVVLMGIVCYFIVGKADLKKEELEENSIVKVENPVREEVMDEEEIVVEEEEPTNETKSSTNTVVKKYYYTNTVTVVKNKDQDKNNKEEPTPVPIKPIEEVKEKKECKVVEYFKNKEYKILNKENIQKSKEKAKEVFIEITDFIFNGKEINGVTFNELTEEIKLEIMDLAVKIDFEIEKEFPGYKEKLKTGLNNFADLLIQKYNETTNKICNKIGTDKCENARKALTVTVNSLEYLTKASIEKLNDWYTKLKLSK